MSPVRSCDGGSRRAVQNQGSCCTGRPRWTVRYRKRPRGVREAHLSAWAARGGGSSAGCHVERMTGASGSRWRIVMAQVRRMPMRARWLQSRCDTKHERRGNEMSQTSKQRRRPAKACRAGLPLKGAVCGSRLGLKKRACAASAGARGYARHKDTAEWLD